MGNTRHKIVVLVVYSYKQSMLLRSAFARFIKLIKPSQII